MQLKVHKYALLTLILFGLGLLVGSTLAPYFRRLTRSPFVLPSPILLRENGAVDNDQNEALFPEEVCGMSKAGMITGLDAADIIYGYVGRDNVIKEAFIGTYKNTEKEVTFFVSVLHSSQDAEMLFQRMYKTLQNKNIIETVHIREPREAFSVYSFQEKDLHHCFFIKGTRVIWLLADASYCEDNIRCFYHLF